MENNFLRPGPDGKIQRKDFVKRHRILLTIHRQPRVYHLRVGARLAGRAASFFFGARIWLGTILGRFSINYFIGLGLRIRVRVWVRIRVRVWVRVNVGVGVRVSVVIWSG